YPNPFNPTTTIGFDLSVATEVSLVVYDILGREVTRLVEGQMPAAYHRLTWNGLTSDGKPAPTGVYIARLVTPSHTESIKMVLLK
ncbi:MAG: T9SS type A sorting domain-containing protein, partial [Candidatus Marinimicrobia bacterium]|nr:T9SS type A sorting domain-containing protein [Candidatus Neomarinimicrobiota bacterium]